MADVYESCVAIASCFRISGIVYVLYSDQTAFCVCCNFAHDDTICCTDNITVSTILLEKIKLEKISIQKSGVSQSNTMGLSRGK